MAFKRPGSAVYHIDLRWEGYPRLRCSTGTRSKATAERMEAMLLELRAQGRRDLLALLAPTGPREAPRLTLETLWRFWQDDPAGLARLVSVEVSPPLGTLVDRFLEEIADPAYLNRRHQPYSARTIARYGQSWAMLFAQLPRGRETPLVELTQGAVAAYRRARREEGVGGDTLNNDMSAIGAFLGWCRRQETVPDPPELTLPRQKAGERGRWLTAEELGLLFEQLPPAWRPMFHLLAATGLRLGEATSLRAADVRLEEGVVRVRRHETHRGKSPRAIRDVPIPREVAAELAAHLVRFPATGRQPFWSAPFGHPQAVRRAMQAAAARAGLVDIKGPHDLRHTYGVHAAMAGVPLPRLQLLMGHEDARMTMKYANHADRETHQEDAARVFASLTDRRRDEAVAELLRDGMRSA